MWLYGSAVLAAVQLDFVGKNPVFACWCAPDPTTGQLLSARADVIPSVWVNELTSLQDRVPPFAFEKVDEILTKQLGNSYNKIISLYKNLLIFVLMKIQ